MRIVSQRSAGAAAAVALAPALALLGPACAAYEARPIDAVASAASFRARRLDDPDLLAKLERSAPEWRRDQPWTLDALTAAALELHGDVRVAMAQWRTALAQVDAASELPNPTFSVGLENSLNPPSGDSPWVIGGNLDFLIETAGKRGARIEIAKRQELAARIELREAAWRVASRVRPALAELFAAREQVAALEGELAQREIAVAIVERRREIGESSAVETQSARSGAARTRAELAAARARHVAARAALAQILGIPDEALDAGAIASGILGFPAEGALGLEHLPADGLLGRGDLARLFAEYDVAEAELELEIARQYPDLHLGPGYMFDQGQNKLVLGVSFDLPIFSRNAGPIAKARAAREEAAARFESLQERAIGELSAARARLAAARGVLADASAAETLETERRDAAERRFALGDGDRLSLVLAEAALLEARRGVVAAVLDAQRALADLEGAVERRLPIRSQANSRPDSRTESRPAEERP